MYEIVMANVAMYGEVFMGLTGMIAVAMALMGLAASAVASWENILLALAGIDPLYMGSYESITEELCDAVPLCSTESGAYVPLIECEASDVETLLVLAFSFQDIVGSPTLSCGVGDRGIVIDAPELSINQPRGWDYHRPYGQVLLELKKLKTKMLSERIGIPYLDLETAHRGGLVL